MQAFSWCLKIEVLFLYITRVLFLSRSSLLTRSKNSTNVPLKLDVALCLVPFLSHLLTATAQVSTELPWTHLWRLKGMINRPSHVSKANYAWLSLCLERQNAFESKFKPKFWVFSLGNSTAGLFFQERQKGMIEEIEVIDLLTRIGVCNAWITFTEQHV